MKTDSRCSDMNAKGAKQIRHQSRKRRNRNHKTKKKKKGNLISSSPVRDNGIAAARKHELLATPAKDKKRRNKRLKEKEKLYKRGSLPYNEAAHYLIFSNLRSVRSHPFSREGTST